MDALKNLTSPRSLHHPRYSIETPLLRKDMLEIELKRIELQKGSASTPKSFIAMN